MEDFVPDQDDQDNPLLFYVAYRKADDGKCHYMGDGKGNLRLFKTQAGLEAFLDEKVPPEMREEIITHSIQGLIALPEADTAAGALVPITTFSFPSVPGSMELLKSLQRRKKL